LSGVLAPFDPGRRDRNGSTENADKYFFFKKVGELKSRNDDGVINIIFHGILQRKGENEKPERRNFQNLLISTKSRTEPRRQNEQ
jgi:hypothetical protein